MAESYPVGRAQRAGRVGHRHRRQQFSAALARRLGGLERNGRPRDPQRNRQATIFQRSVLDTLVANEDPIAAPKVLYRPIAIFESNLDVNPTYMLVPDADVALADTTYPK